MQDISRKADALNNILGGRLGGIGWAFAPTAVNRMSQIVTSIQDVAPSSKLVNAMDNDFLRLIDENVGFEFVLGFIDYEDHYIGGNSKRIWYYTKKGRKQELWMAYRDGSSDSHYKISGKNVTETILPPGTTLQKIIERAYWGQDVIESSSRKPEMREECGFAVHHYSFSFGETAYQISDDYNITVGYSDINDITVGYRLRDIFTSKDVEPNHLSFRRTCNDT